MRTVGIKRICLGLLLLILAAGLTGCAGAGGRGPEGRIVNLSVLAQKLYGAGSGGVVRLKQGDTVTIRITADEPMEVFLHGYDVETRVRPGEYGTMQFTANIVGRHALMIHALGEEKEDDKGSHEKLEILLGLVDVQPRR